MLVTIILWNSLVDIPRMDKPASASSRGAWKFNHLSKASDMNKKKRPSLGGA